MSDTTPTSPIGLTLLVVDDEPGVRMSLDFLLSGAGYRVITADSGRAAVRLMETELIDGALLDLHMPGMNGIETCLALHGSAARIGRPLHVWFMSGAYGRELERHCGELGAIRVFRKPFEWPQILDVLTAGFAVPAATPAPLSGPPCVADNGPRGVP